MPDQVKSIAGGIRHQRPPNLPTCHPACQPSELNLLTGDGQGAGHFYTYLLPIIIPRIYLYLHGKVPYLTLGYMMVQDIHRLSVYLLDHLSHIKGDFEDS